jgi:hypothetical protein
MMTRLGMAISVQGGTYDKGGMIDAGSSTGKAA